MSSCCKWHYGDPPGTTGTGSITTTIHPPTVVPPQVVDETELVHLARRIVRDALNTPEGYVYSENYWGVKIDLAKWVIENIWTPESDE